MNLIKKILVITLSIFVFSCSENDEITFIKKDINVLILGNSILKHGPAFELGWYNDCGMASTSTDKDFLHVYTNLLKTSNKYNNVDITSKNIAVWENDFNYNLNQFVDITSKSYDVIIIRLGENVNDTNQYKIALNNMINLFKTQNTRVIITGIIWENEIKENVHKQVVLDNNYEYISFEYFRSNSSNYSWGLFNNSAVAAHPSDLGMKHIGQLLYNSTIK